MPTLTTSTTTPQIVLLATSKNMRDTFHDGEISGNHYWRGDVGGYACFWHALRNNVGQYDEELIDWNHPDYVYNVETHKEIENVEIVYSMAG